jgi:hypothetical protein
LFSFLRFFFAFPADTVKDYPEGFYLTVKTFAYVLYDIDRINSLYVRDTAAFPADEMVMLRYIVIEMLEAVAGADLLYLALIAEQREIAVDSTQTDVGVYLPDVAENHIGSGVVKAV